MRFLFFGFFYSFSFISSIFFTFYFFKYRCSRVWINYRNIKLRFKTFYYLKMFGLRFRFGVVFFMVFLVLGGTVVFRFRVGRISLTGFVFVMYSEIVSVFCCVGCVGCENVISWFWLINGGTYRYKELLRILSKWVFCFWSIFIDFFDVNLV